MDFIKKKAKDFYLYDTKIENVFINEYLPGAPGDYVKVYLYGYMYAEHGLRISEKELASQLGMSERDVSKAWEYWENAGVLRRRTLDPDGKLEPTVEFLSMKELMYGKVDAGTENNEEPETNIFGNENVKKLFDEVEKTLSRNLSSTELSEVLSWIEQDNIAPEVVLLGFTYSAERNKANIRYVGKVVHSWHSDGYYTAEQVQDHLEETDRRYTEYKRVMSALGMGGRYPTEKERKIMDSWFDDLGYNMDKVLEACEKTSGISTPNFNYVNKVLENWAADSEKAGTDVNSEHVSQSVLMEYYAYLRDKAESEAEARKQEVYEKVPRIKEIDAEVSKLGAELSRKLIMGQDRGDSKEIQDRMDGLAVERAAELTDHGFGVDHTDIQYKCSKCNDTGLSDLGERCTCVADRTKEAATWMKSPEAKNRK